MGTDELSAYSVGAGDEGEALASILAANGVGIVGEAVLADAASVVVDKRCGTQPTSSTADNLPIL